MLDSKTHKAGIIGWPVGHSISPVMHAYWLKEHSLSGAYDALPVKPGGLPKMLELLAEQQYAGVNVTIPHKQSILPFLDEVDPSAAAVGAVNTLVRKNKKWLGMNTDIYGFSKSLTEAVDVKKIQRVMVLGAGGAAGAVVKSLQELGFTHITISNRTREKAEELASHAGAKVVDWENKDTALERINLLVNTTSRGMKGEGGLDINLNMLPSQAVVADIVYNPLVTPLLQQAQEKGHLTVDGLGMLMHQGAAAFAAWFGITPKVDDKLRAFLQETL